MAIPGGSRRRGSRTAKVITIVAGVVVVLGIAGLVVKTGEPDEGSHASSDSTISASVSAAPTSETARPPLPTPGATTTAESVGAAPAVPAFYSVTSVVDGDTLHVSIDGQDKRVRVIGIDAPEMNECGGADATTAATAILNGQSVQLVGDLTQDDKDRYDRLLRYVLLADGTDFGLKMINDGHAYEYTYNSPHQNQASYQSVQAASIANGNGMWNPATCNGQRVSPAPQPAPVQQAPAAVPATSTSEVGSGSCDIKGNINSKDEKIYHTPGSRDYDKTQIDESKGERWFCSVAEAETAGWRAPRN